MAGLTGGIPGAMLSAGSEVIAGIKHLASSTAAASLTVEQMAEQLKESSEDSTRRGIREFRDDFEELLEESGITKLIVVIDDLDRCLPETILETLEAIKLFLFVPRTAFILGADERLVKYAVRRRFPELPGQLVEVGSDYLEKLIQYPIYVPPLGRGEMETYINLLFAKLAGLSDADFESARKQAIQCDPDSLLVVRFNYAIAKNLLQERTPKGLDDRLATAQRIPESKRLRIEQIVQWAKSHRQITGKWPNKESGAVKGVRGQGWAAIDLALRRGGRGLPGGSSLSKLFRELPVR